MLARNTKTDVHDILKSPPGTDPICEAVKKIACAVWTDVADAADHRVRLGEESITDGIALELARAASTLPLRLQFRTLQLTRDEEHACGADWEWFIGNDRRGWYRFLVQAKKLDPVKGTYPELQRADRRERQIAALRAAAAAATKNPNEARPTLLYVLYNGMPSVDPSRDANAQFGVAVLPLDAIEKLASGRDFTFDTVRAATRPWHDMVCFDRLQTFALEEPVRELPSRIRERSSTVAGKGRGTDVSRGPATRTVYARYTVAIEIGTTAAGEQPMPAIIAFQ